MPTYLYNNTKTGEDEQHFMSWKELEQFQENNQHLVKMVTAAAIVGGLGSGGVKSSDGMKEVFQKAAEAHPSSPLAERYGRRSIKDIKTQTVVDKHRKISKLRSKD